MMMNAKRTFSTLLASISLLGVATFAGCATPPKPRELETFETLRKNPSVPDAAKKSPDLIASSDRLGAKATEEWQSNDRE